MSHFTLGMAALVDRFCEGDIAPEQAARLETLVAESDEARQYLLDCFQIHCELAWELGRQSLNLSQADRSDDVLDPCSSSPGRIARESPLAFSPSRDTMIVVESSRRT